MLCIFWQLIEPMGRQEKVKVLFDIRCKLAHNFRDTNMIKVLKKKLNFLINIFQADRKLLIIAVAMLLLQRERTFRIDVASSS